MLWSRKRELIKERINNKTKVGSHSNSFLSLADYFPADLHFVFPSEDEEMGGSQDEESLNISTTGLSDFSSDDEGLTGQLHFPEPITSTLSNIQTNTIEESSSSEEEDMVSDMDISGLGENNILLDGLDSFATAEQEKLVEEMIGDYKPSDFPPVNPPSHTSLAPEEELSLKHYMAWKQSRGTDLAYKLHAKILSDATGFEILSLYKVRRLVEKLTGVSPKRVDVCRNSCIAYTGQYANLQSCPFLKKKGVICGLDRYRPSSSLKKVAYVQMLVIPIIPRIQAMYANPEAARMMLHRSQVMHSRDTTSPVYEDFAGGEALSYLASERKLFSNPMDVAIAGSSDGAMVSLKKQSSSWFGILSNLNLPGNVRYHSKHTMIVIATPGPNSLS